MIVLDKLVQGSDEWFTEKLGKPSASCASQIITTKGVASKSQEGYLYTLAAEIVTGQREEGFKSAAMEMGNEREQESRDCYEFLTSDTVEQVGVVYKDKEMKFLASPDGLCNKRKYGLELKNVLPKTQVGYLIADKLPTAYFQQIQFSLYVTGLKKWVFASYSPGLRMFIHTVDRDEMFIRALGIQVEAFYKELHEIVERIKV